MIHRKLCPGLKQAENCNECDNKGYLKSYVQGKKKQGWDGTSGWAGDKQITGRK